MKGIFDAFLTRLRDLFRHGSSEWAKYRRIIQKTKRMRERIRRWLQGTKPAKKPINDNQTLQKHGFTHCFFVFLI